MPGNAFVMRGVNEMRWNPPEWLSGWKSLWDRYKYALLVVLVGVFLLLVPDSDAENQTAQPPPETAMLSAGELEEKLAHTLSQIQGAGRVSVALTVKEGARQVLAQDVEQATEETTREHVLVSEGSGRQNVVPLQSIGPVYQGALVVCDGGDDSRVRLQMMEGVRVLTGLSSDKISVSKRG